MNIVKAGAIYLDPEDMHPYEFMERAGRTCYKSLDNITPDSNVRFVQQLKNSGHTAMLEHSHIILKVNTDNFGYDFLRELHTNDIYSYDDNTRVHLSNYINVSMFDHSSDMIISGSFRAFLMLYQVDNKKSSRKIKYLLNYLNQMYPDVFNKKWNNSNIIDEDIIKMLSRSEFIDYINDMKFFFKDNPDIIKELNHTISKHLTHTVLFTTDRGVSHEYVRHRPASFAQESTRYCNYSKNKFGNEITILEPVFWNKLAIANAKENAEKKIKCFEIWKDACEYAEKAYFKLLDLGATPQEARSVLPNSLKTEIIITATEEEWQHIINLRYHGTTGAPHPQMVESMSLIYDTLCEKSDHRLK